MEQEIKETYNVPTMEVVEVKAEGTLCLSAGPLDEFENNGSGKELYNW